MAEIKSEKDKDIDHIIDKLVGMGKNRTLTTIVVDEYFSNIKNELTQIYGLVNDVVSNLANNFKYISSLIKAHQNMVMSINRMTISEERNLFYSY